jgi:hypothetical protein
VGRGEIRCGERQLPEIALAFAFHFQVSDGSREHQGLLEMRPSFGIIPQLHADLAEMDQTGSLAELLAELTKCAERLLGAFARPYRVALLQVRQRQRRQRPGSLTRVAKASPQRETFCQHRHCTLMITLPCRECPAYIQGVAAGDVRKSRERKRRTHVVACLRGITAKNRKFINATSIFTAITGSTPPASANAMAARKLAKLIMLRSIARVGSSQLAACGFGNAPVVFAVPRRRRCEVVAPFQLLLCEFADRLEHAVALPAQMLLRKLADRLQQPLTRATALMLEHDQRFLDE